MSNLGKLLRKRLFRNNRRAAGVFAVGRTQKAYLFEEYEGLFYIREEFNLDRLGVMGTPSEIVIEGKIYSLYFVCRTEDGRRFFVGIEKGEPSDRQLRELSLVGGE